MEGGPYWSTGWECWDMGGGGFALLKQHHIVITCSTVVQSSFVNKAFLSGNAKSDSSSTDHYQAWLRWQPRLKTLILIEFCLGGEFRTSMLNATSLWLFVVSFRLVDSSREQTLWVDLYEHDETILYKCSETSVRPILISDIEYQHICCNLNCRGWKNVCIPMFDKPNLMRLVYDVAVAGCNLTSELSVSVRRSKCAASAQGLFLYTSTAQGDGEGGEWSERERENSRHLTTNRPSSLLLMTLGPNSQILS